MHGKFNCITLIGHNILEKLILKQIHYIESTNQLDFTGNSQHGFKCNRSTATAGALLQSIISQAANEIFLSYLR